MQFFRSALVQKTGRAFALALAYVLVVHALLSPLRAVAAVLPDAGSAIICSVDDGGAQKQSAHHDCEAGCFMQGGGLLADPVRPVFAQLPITAFVRAVPARDFDFDRKHAPLLATGKAPGAPPRL